jgi:hypothetical protein
MAMTMRRVLTGLIAGIVVATGVVVPPTAANAAPAPYILVGQGPDACPAGYACLWEAAWYRGRGVGFYNRVNDFGALPAAYRFINNTASSGVNHGTSGMAITLAVNRSWESGGALTICRPYGEYDFTEYGMNDQFSSLTWFWAEPWMC